MKLQNAVQWERLLFFTTEILMLPLWLVRLALEVVNCPFETLLNAIIRLRHAAGNWMLRRSDEVKNGVILNDYAIRNYTAQEAYKLLKERKAE